jgi:hypothetical protein
MVETRRAVDEPECLDPGLDAVEVAELGSQRGEDRERAPRADLQSRASANTNSPPPEPGALSCTKRTSSLLETGGVIELSLI